MTSFVDRLSMDINLRPQRIRRTSGDTPPDKSRPQGLLDLRPVRATTSRFPFRSPLRRHRSLRCRIGQRDPWLGFAPMTGTTHRCVLAAPAGRGTRRRYIHPLRSQRRRQSAGRERECQRRRSASTSSYAAAACSGDTLVGIGERCHREPGLAKGKHRAPSHSCCATSCGTNRRRPKPVRDSMGSTTQLPAPQDIHRRRASIRPKADRKRPIARLGKGAQSHSAALWRALRHCRICNLRPCSVQQISCPNARPAVELGAGGRMVV
jgi:hypothetical protein